MSSALECKCGSLDSIIGNMLTTSVCNSISLLDTEIMFVTCEDAYPATSKPYHEAVSSEEEVKLIQICASSTILPWVKSTFLILREAIRKKDI